MKIHKNAVIRNRPVERIAQEDRDVYVFRWTRCGLRTPKDHTRDRWARVDCKNCLRTKRRP